MDISSGSSYPSSSLSNFAGHRFVFDGVECYSMEGFLQSLKFKNFEVQKEICKLIGKKAKIKGASKNWRKTQLLYWNNNQYKRDSDEYQKLLDDVYNTMFNQSESFRNALKASGNSSLTHSKGKKNIKDTVLTTKEFISRLYKLREQLL